MSYQVLYRAWRPATFSEIVGQDAIVQTLRRQVVSGAIAHAYLFCGTRGTGKTTASKVLSRAVNCLNPHDGDPCGTCEVCRAILSETCMDVMEIDAASNNGVDEIRDLRERIKYPPALARYKVYIIDEVHMLSSGAFNALLKTLEEPPAHAIFILATTEPHRLPSTILSRCQRFDFHRIGASDLIARMQTVLRGIGREAEPEALSEIARAAQGAMRDALSLLDASLATTEGTLTLAQARNALGITGGTFLFDFCDALIAYDAPRALKQIDRAMRSGHDPQVFAREVTTHLRCALLAAQLGDISDVADVTREDAQAFAEQGNRAGSEQLMRQMDLFMRVESDMRWSSQPRTALELAAMRACHPETESEAQMEERLRRLEQMLKNGVPAVQPAPQTPEKPDPAPRTPRAKAPEKPVPAGQPPEGYDEAIARFREENHSAVLALQLMQFAGYENGVLHLRFPSGQAVQMGLLRSKAPALEKAFSDAFGAPTHVQIDLEGLQKKSGNALPEVVSRAITHSYDIFGRENVELVD